jgi:hypothetical protein
VNYYGRLLLISLLILGFLFLTSCVAPSTLRELENEALTTGDWSRVEKRERRDSYDNAMNEMIASCDYGTMLVCIDLPIRKDVRDIKWNCRCRSARAISY